MFKTFSNKQRRLLRWWTPTSPDCCHDAIICDGAVRSGKTVCMALSFFLWSMTCFNGASFALCGKTIASLRRNLLTPIVPFLRSIGFTVKEKISANYADMSIQGRSNRYYFFGGKDEGSAAMIQGMTLGGVLFDEVALMPRSFVEQAAARCSLAGSRYWFNCNPENPMHWFRQEWLEKCGEKNALHLHFTMSDNPALAPSIRRRYEKLYSGSFYDRFVLGKWVAVEGLVYPMFDHKIHVRELEIRNEDMCANKVKNPTCQFCESWRISCDYGTVNPSSFGLWGLHDGAWYRVQEYYYDSRREQNQRTDEEHYAALEKLAGNLPIDCIVADPSAASFLALISKRGRFRVVRAKNDVTDGIRRVSSMLKNGKLFFSANCKDTLREFSLYRWEENSGRDIPRKENDHAMDDIRYFVSSLDEGGEDNFFVGTVGRGY